MKANVLLPHRFKAIGWYVIIIGAAFGISWFIFLQEDGLKLLDITVFALIDQDFLESMQYFTTVKTNFTDEIIGSLMIVGLLLVAFSREEYEDEYIARLRTETLVWATYFNYLVLLVAVLFIYNLAFFWVLVFNMFTTLVFFIIRFSWILKKLKSSVVNEK